MRQRHNRRLCQLLAITLITSVSLSHGLGAQEFVVNQQVISDTAVEGMVVDGHSVIGSDHYGSGSYDSGSYDSGSYDSGSYDSGSYDSGSVDSGNPSIGTSDGEVTYVGDMSASDAGVTVGSGGGGMQRRSFGQPDLFYNYFTQGYSNQANAQMYLSPLPVPPNVGHTFYTYQPFYPHHMLYAHKDRYHRYYDNGRGMNRTRAVYYSPPIKTAASNFYWNYLRLAR